MTKGSQNKSGRKQQPTAKSPATGPAPKVLARGSKVLLIPVLAGALLLGQGMLMSASPPLFRAFMAAAVVLFAWTAWVWMGRRGSDEPLEVFPAVFAHHWVQALAHTALFIWWGMHVRLVGAYAPLILAQVIFAYGVSSLLDWSRRGKYGLGFGPLPIVGSTNLFLWFKPEWFHWQFAMILVGYLAKELIRWQKNGRSAHIFNPSSFPLAVFSLVLIVTRTTDITWGQAIATTQFYPPHMYLAIFLVTLPAQLLFGVARMTLSAVVSLYLFSLAFFAATGTYFFYDSHIPLPVFLGMHLLFTDPSTSPRSELGRVWFGVIYAAGTAFLYWALGAVGVPTFYDKLLPVPIMNLMVRRIDALVAAGWMKSLDPAKIAASLTPKMRHVAWTGAWVAIFIGMSSVQGVGDHHRGQSLHFWMQTCDAGNERACNYTVAMTGIYCQDGSGWACNEWGARQMARGELAGGAFDRGCRLGYRPACENARSEVRDAAMVARGEPGPDDLPIVLRGAKPPLVAADMNELHAVGCSQGWSEMCSEATTASGA